ncbi:hypothetical protein H6F43_06900 [Leptolyngbya sp. FACHB-36]|uniref:hypothetical protein n=1 Tax=Leptolyngbya sp. FACHB-36 TaxID=2692808 RepID=UPI00167FF2F1|nr:hypothetical protein [Leptolyngbya sp. FACHB-36]MBD2019915.1 hypothetical protein [Leptolyngbya sp. FACHB-36]
MYDNKIRLSPDVIEKANQIAQEWGLKNARAAVEAVFRRYCDEYLNGRAPTGYSASPGVAMKLTPSTAQRGAQSCEAIDELDDLLGL